VISYFGKEPIVIERFVRERLVYLSHWLSTPFEVFTTQPAFASGYATVNATTLNWSDAIGTIKSAMTPNAAASSATAKTDVVDCSTVGFATDEGAGTSTSDANDDAEGIKRDRSNDWKNLQLWVDAVTETNLRELAEAVEAASLSELIRRALRAREDFHPDESDFADTIVPSKASRKNARRITVTLPSTSVERVERLKQATGKDFRSLVYEAVLVFAELNEMSKNADSIKLY
jgi:hypothetical protein